MNGQHLTGYKGASEVDWKQSSSRASLGELLCFNYCLTLNLYIWGLLA